jgi:peptidoglycan/LPS O-acetylase OafA/YrhL
VGAVVLYHAGLPFLPGGYLGVDIFFVISGFLITSHLLRSLDVDGRINFAQFYARRIRRILPASFAVLILSIVASIIWVPPLLLEGVLQDAVATALYVPNYLFAAQGTDYLAETTPSVFQHYWSLGIEEQFYLIWPALLAGGFALTRSRRMLFAAVAGLVVLSFAACVVLTTTLQPWAFFSLPTRAWELGVGGLVAFYLSVRPGGFARVPSAIIGWLGLFGLAASICLFDESTLFPGFAAAVPVLSVAAVILAGTSRPRLGPSRLLSTRPFQFVGLISYSLYLVHWPLLVIPQAAVGYYNPLPFSVKIALVIPAVLISYLLYRFIENPARDWEWLTSALSSRSILLAAGASLSSVAVCFASIGLTGRVTLDAGKTAPELTATMNPLGTDFVPSNMTPSLRNAANDNPALYADGCHNDFEASDVAGCSFGDPSSPKIVLFGDSHAAQWFPAVLAYASDQGYSVETHTKSSCPSITVDVFRAGSVYESCNEWRTAVIEKVASERPAMVLLSNYGQADLRESGSDYSTEWAEGLTSTITALQPFTQVGVIVDTPDFKQNPAICLSASLEDALDCSRTRDFALSSATRDAEDIAVKATGAYRIDLTDYICNSRVCPAVIGSHLVYRDAHHLTASFSASLARPLSDQLQPLLDNLDG